jgi:hypothetical protein
MTTDDSFVPPNDPSRPRVRANVLWAGGVATAVVAALIGWAGVIVCQRVFNVDLVPIGGSDNANIWAYPLIAFLIAIIMTGVLHLMLLFVPQPARFFNWIMGLLLVVATALPFAGGASASTFLTALLDFLIMLAIWLLIAGIAMKAVHPTRPQSPQPPPPSPGYGQPPTPGAP